MRDAKVSAEDLLKFRTSVSEADFLFGPEVPEYIDEIYKHGVQLCRWVEEYRDYTQPTQEGCDHKKVVDNKYKELEWLSNQFEPAKDKFKKYLDISRQ